LAIHLKTGLVFGQIEEQEPKDPEQWLKEQTHLFNST
jgi:hypothetical protein